MVNVLNISNIPEEYTDDPKFASKMRTIFMGAAAGSRKIYVNIDYIKPGAKSVKYHSHSRQEEFFFILKGTGTLRMNDGKVQVKAGDFVAKPAGDGLAHQFFNNGEEVLEILDCGTKEDNDIITYPDEDLVLLREEGLIFKKSDAQESWSSEPNE